MPLSVFQGRALAEETSHTRDQAGRIIASKTIRDPAWLDADRLLALALHTHETGMCDGCGQPRSRSYHPDMDGWYDVDVLECAGCAALADGAPKHADHRHKLALTDTRPPDRPLPPTT